MKKAIGILLIVLPVISMSMFAFTGQVWWVDASGDEGRQALIAIIHYFSLMAGFFYQF